MIFKLILFTYFFSANWLSDNPAACAEMNIKYAVESKTPGQHAVAFEISGGTGPYQVIFFDAKGRLISNDFTKKIFEHLPAGQYQCLVVDQKNCSSIVNVSIP